MWNQIQQALDQSVARIVSGLVELLPGAMALVLAVLVSAICGWLLGSMLRRMLRGVDFDRHVVNWGWSELSAWSPGKSPTVLVGGVVSWAVVILGFLIGLSAFDPTLTSRVMTRLFGSLINLVTASVLILAGVIMSRFVSRGVLISLVNLNIEQARLVSVGVRWLLLVLSAAMALNQLGIGGGVVNLAFAILFGGIVLSLSLAVGLRTKDTTNLSQARQPERSRQGESQSLEHL